MIDGSQWQPFKNLSRETIPPFAVVWIDGAGVRPDQSPYLEARKPDWFGGQWLHFLNGPVSVEPEEFGACTSVFPAMAAFDSEDGEPSPGEMWGPRADDWTLRKNAGGFRVVGRPITDDGIDRVLVIREPRLMLIGKTLEEISEGAIGDVLVLEWRANERGVVTLEEPEDEEANTIRALEVIGGISEIDEDVRVICTWEPGLVIDDECRGWMITAFAC